MQHKLNPYLQVEGLTKRIGERTLFEKISFGIAERQRVGLIARNGTGKTTLLNIIAGKEGYDEGSVIYKRDIRVGYLEQVPQFSGCDTVLETCMQAERPTVSSTDKEIRAKQILSQLKIQDFQQRIDTLSGGQQKRVALARVLLTEPDLLILDEPTNHLDLGMIEWLEGFLKRGTMAVFMVTHDRYFLENVCSLILELDDQTLYSYRGNYSYYLEKRQARIDVANATAERTKNLYRRELEWMRTTPSARTGKSEYRKQTFYKLKDLSQQSYIQENIQLKLKESYIGSKIFEAEYVCKSYEDKVILKDFYYNFSRYEKMGIAGNNGTGKSTFIKMLLGLVKPDSGRFVVGETVTFGYYSQEGMVFDEQMKVIDAVRQIAEYVDLGSGKHLTAMQFLNHFLFTPKDQQKYVYKLSGGERRRLYLCTVLMKAPNFLILDEPTNDLDIATLQILEEYLRDFKGCVIIVSHDRYFMDKVVDHILVFKGEGVVKDFPGNYTQYRQYEASKEQEKQTTTDKRTKDTTATQTRNVTHKPKLTYKQKQELQSLSKQIDELETEKKNIENLLCGGLANIEEITALSKRLPILEAELDAISTKWFELSELEND